MHTLQNMKISRKNTKCNPHTWQTLITIYVHISIEDIQHTLSNRPNIIKTDFIINKIKPFAY